MRALLVLILCLTSCSRTAPPAQAHEETFPAGSPMANSIHFTYAVYLLPGVTHGDTLGEVPRLLTRHKLKTAEKIPERPDGAYVSAHFITDAQKSYPPPTLESLDYRGEGLSRRQKQALQQSREAVVLEFAHPKASVWPGLRTATVLVEELARKSRGLIYDEETRQVFTPDEWHKRRIDSWPSTAELPQASDQFTIDIYQHGEYYREVTRGLAKMGLPDLAVQELPEKSSNQSGNLINSVAQILAEGAAVTHSGTLRLDLHAIRNVPARDDILKQLGGNALAAACVLVKPGEKDDGDPHNRLMELSPDLYSGPDPHAKLDNLFSSLFGFKDTAAKVKHSQELLEESKKEKAKLSELRKAFLAGLGPGEFIELKAPFPTPEGNNEWMWVEVTRWRGKTITGTLDNDPAEIPDLKAGQVVEIWQDDVFDYIRRFPDGHTEGNTTGKILEKLEQITEQPLRTRGEMPSCE